jgi:hypothetical protein
MCGGMCADLKTDNANCGKCGNACPMGASCVQGSCQCASGTTRCGDACVDVKTDVNNCGKCGTTCGGADAGPIMGGGTWGCANGACAIMCPQPKKECSGACVDLQTDNDNCGMCGNACAQTETCMQGLCCKTGQKVCNMACTDTNTDAMNCGMCGNACPMNKPYCNQGMCTTGVVYSEMFTQGATPSTQCSNWNTFRAALTGVYSSITIKGSNDMVGVTCTGNQANQLCQALKNNQAVNVGVCNGRTWATGPCGANSIELTATGSICNCNSGYTVRPCINNLNRGGVNTSTCNAPTQTITVICQ